MDVIDWNAVNWFGVFIFVAMAFLAAFVANFINMIFDGNPFSGAIMAAFLFGVIYVGWTYYPHGIDIGQEKLPVAGGTVSPGS